jgi:hypothetical protein
MEMKEVMVLWSPTEWHSKHEGKPQIRIVRHAANNLEWNYLLKSMGACNARWWGADPVEQAGHLLALFTQAVGRDGVPAKQAHEEFLRIREYREWIEKQTGPFRDAYWRWQNAIGVAA